MPRLDHPHPPIPNRFSTSTREASQPMLSPQIESKLAMIANQLPAGTSSELALNALRAAIYSEQEQLTAYYLRQLATVQSQPNTSSTPSQRATLFTYTQQDEPTERQTSRRAPPPNPDATRPPTKPGYS